MGAVRIAALVALAGIAAVACGGEVGTGGVTSTGGTGTGGAPGSGGVTGGNADAGGQGAAGTPAAGQGGQVVDASPCACVAEPFDIIVPKDRSQDAIVSVTGPCGSADFVTGADPSDHFFQALGVGTCHVTVTFNGARTFQTDVPILPYPGPCCVGAPMAQLPKGVVYVPEPEPVDAAIGD